MMTGGIGFSPLLPLTLADVPVKPRPSAAFLIFGGKKRRNTCEDLVMGSGLW